jgi:crotonobetainyl-CoA:carnitine CoA-transferase CaiB-like acyl-CoA transferase
MILEGPGEIEPMRLVGSPIKMTDAPVTLRIAPPKLGRHTDEVKAELTKSLAAE